MKNEQKKTILVVEDELPLRNALIDKLDREGFITLTASDGVEGLIVAGKHNPDLILLDIIMPKMDGLTMMKKLRGSGQWGQKVPIILLTNSGPGKNKIDLSIFTKEDESYYLVKSNWSLNTVVKKVRERLFIT